MRKCKNISILILLSFVSYSSATFSELQIKNEPILPIPFTLDLDQRKVSLGERLFNDKLLSHKNRIACAQCHQVNQGGDDGLKTSITNNGEPDLINSPSIFNTVFNFRHTWRGAFRSLELQAEADLKNPRHSASSWKELLPKLKSNTGYKKEFNKIYSKGINRYSVLDAIATYEKSLITPNSRFDQYLRGNNSALTNDELKGYAYFKRYGCVACHQGINIGGNVFQKFGLFDNYFEHRGNITKVDYGLFNVSGNEKDRYVFKVPSLRNISITSPYLHDGTLKELEDVVNVMAKYQLGTTLKEEHVKLIVKFLHTLTGEYNGKPLKEENK